MKQYSGNIIKTLAFAAIILTGTKIQAQTVSTPQQMVDALHGTFGKHSNARAVHAKGIILQGTFIPGSEAKKITKAAHFQNKSTPVTLRFSDFTGIPSISDTNPLSNPRGLAIKFNLPSGQTTDIIAHSYNGFPVATTDEFRQLLQAISSSGPNAPHPTALEQFFVTHPIAKTFLTSQKPATTSFATLSYYGVNSFKFTNQKGKSKFIRYQFIPVEGEHFLTKEELASYSPDYLSEEITKRTATKPFQFKLYAQIAEEGDEIANPSIAWSDSRKLVLLGTITINALGDNSTQGDKKLSFLPNNITDGIEIADPMLDDRSKAYPISVKERQ
ncbi:catalase family peroxidase [Chryseobacterium sp. Tr-659]|uniref:catalase family peroxidase n=1 Tax=Chryseobacterium sp. Tr-659 TaxID=2608340 RepID=UPI001423A322|nr:catalase family peroxidase [Chryseobacterium sp. Tr-659]NIF04730.1 catalase family peroxidase [Chryseobacterium sp. Tr-659]